ncbi:MULTISPECIES: SDR family NAD(P)-dependent oxidoreductase [unclassified Commensalibacter]|uniref:SDR family NAD(P)-dependent oxidoreductase n=1 Tax=unclassified Commensalibacter TaxID=2630218 RepID=UPI00351BF3F7
MVTGADSGISKAIALKYLEEDIKCVLVDLKNLHELHLLLEDQFITLTADISKKEDI